MDECLNRCKRLPLPLLPLLLFGFSGRKTRDTEARFAPSEELVPVVDEGVGCGGVRHPICSVPGNMICPLNLRRPNPS